MDLHQQWTACVSARQMQPLDGIPLRVHRLDDVARAIGDAYRAGMVEPRQALERVIQVESVHNAAQVRTCQRRAVAEEIGHDQHVACVPSARFGTPVDIA